MKWMKFSLFVLPALVFGCDIWQPWPPTEKELDEGLVVLYPGSFNTSTEMICFYYGLRDGGITSAIEVHHWAGFLEHMIFVEGTAERNRDRARLEAESLAQYKREHPNGTITLVGFSGGAVMSVLVPQEMPADVPIDRVVMLSPAVARETDLRPTLARLTNGAVVYWSPRDDFTAMIAESNGLADGSFGDPAATFGFDTAASNLFQVEWHPKWLIYENYGGHADYVLRIPWIRDVVAPWVAGEAP